jgi:hypothetical protein
MKKQTKKAVKKPTETATKPERPMSAKRALTVFDRSVEGLWDVGFFLQDAGVPDLADKILTTARSLEDGSGVDLAFLNGETVSV